MSASTTIGTAILRADLYPDEERTAFRNDFRQYLEARIHYFEAGRDIVEIEKARGEAGNYGKQLWARATKLSQQPDRYAASMQMIPALNEMFDITTTRTAVTRMHPPVIIFIMLAAVIGLWLWLRGRVPVTWEPSGL